MEVPDIDAGGAELRERFFDVFSDYGRLVHAGGEGVELFGVLDGLRVLDGGGEGRPWWRFRTRILSSRLVSSSLRCLHRDTMVIYDQLISKGNTNYSVERTTYHPSSVNFIVSSGLEVIRNLSRSLNRIDLSTLFWVLNMKVSDTASLSLRFWGIQGQTSYLEFAGY